MNKVYRTVWNEHTNTWVAVQETAKAHGKSASVGVGIGEAILTRVGTSVPRFVSSAVALALAATAGYAHAGPGIYINDGQDDNCTTLPDSTGTVTYALNPGQADPIGTPLKGVGSVWVPDANYFGIASPSAYNPCKSRTNTNKGSELHDQQTNRTLFYGDKNIAASATDNGAKNLTLGGRLDVNSGVIGIGSRGTNGVDPKFTANADYRDTKGNLYRSSNSIRMGTGITLDEANNKEASIAIGVDTKVTAPRGVAIGWAAEATQKDDVAYGVQAKASGGQTVALGPWTQAIGAQSTAIGNNSISRGDSSIAIGGDDLNAVSKDAAGNFNRSAAALKYKALTGDELVQNVASPFIVTESGAAAVAVGVQSKASGNLSAAFGTRSAASGVGSLALGVGANASKENAIALGAGSTTVASAAAVLKATVGAYTYGDDALKAFAGGKNITAGDQVSVGSAGFERQIKHVAPGAINATSTDAINGSQLFYVTQGLQEQIAAASTNGIHFYHVNGANTDNNYNNDGATGNKALAAGINAKAAGASSVAVGSAEVAEKSVVGQSNSEGAVAIGDSAYAAGRQAVTLGASRAEEEQAVAIGSNARSSGKASTAIGASAVASKENSISIGSSANAAGNNSVAIGADSSTVAAGSVALGYTSQATRAAIDATQVQANAAPTVANNQVYALASASNVDQNNITATVKGELGAVSVGTQNGTRQIINVAAGTEDSDAVNVAQLKAVANQIAASASSAATHYYSVKGSGSTDGNYNNDGATGDKSMAAGVNASAKTNNSIAIGTNASVDAGTATAYPDTVTGTVTGVGSVAVGADSAAKGTNAAAFGQKAEAFGQNSLAAGQDSHATGKSSVALGDGARGSQDSATAVGVYTKASGAGATAIGSSAEAKTWGATALGLGAKAITNSSTTAIGHAANATGASATAVGAAASATGNNAVAVGNDSTAAGASSFAAGHGAEAGAVNSVSIGLNAGKGASNNIRTIAIGDSAAINSNGNNNVAVGTQAMNGYVGNASIGIGEQAGLESKGQHNTVIGWTAARHLDGDDNIAIGTRANDATAAAPRTVANTVALGSDTKATVNGAVAVGNKSVASTAAGVEGADPLNAVTAKNNATWTSTEAAVSVGDVANNITRQITGVAAGKEDTDVVNVAQLKAVASQITTQAVATTPLNVGDGNNGNPAGKVIAPIPADANKLATAGDIANAINNSGFQATAGGNLASGTTATATTVKPGQQVTFAAGNGLTVKQEVDGTNGNQTYTYALDAQTVVQNAQTPVVYTDTNGNKVYKHADGNFYDKPEGQAGAQPVQASNVIASMQDADGKTTKPTTLANVKSNLADAAAATGNQNGNDRATLAANKGNNAATVNDVLNAGFTVQGNGADKDFVTHGDTINFANGQGTVANVSTTGGVTTVKFDTPMTYVNNAGVPTSDPSNKVNLVGGNANAPVTLGNVADGTIGAGSKEAINGGQLHDLKENGFKIAADNGTADTVKLTETVTYKGDSNIVTTVSDNQIGFKLADSITVGPATGGNPVKIDGTNGTVTGLTNKTWDPNNITSGRGATEDQLKAAVATTPLNVGDGNNGNPAGKVIAPIPADANKLATAGDIANAINNSGFQATAGGNLASGTTATATTVKPGQQVTFAAGNGLTVKQEVDGTNGNQTYTYALDAQTVVQNAQTPVVYTDTNGNKVYKHADGNFYDKPEGQAGAQPVQASNVIASMQDADGKTTKPTTLANVKSNLADAAAATGNQNGNDRATLAANKGNNAATVNDVLNAGFTVQGNGADKDFVTHGDTINFANGQGTVANVSTTGGVTTVKFDTPMTYVNNAGVPTSDPSNKVNLVGGNANAPVTLGNVADGTIGAGSKEAINGGQLHDLKENGFKIAADNGTADTVKLTETVTYKGDSNIVTTVSDNQIGFKLADSITVGPATGGHPVKIDGNAGTVTGLTNKTWTPGSITSGRAATEDQLKAAQAAASNKVTAGDGITVTDIANTDGSTTYKVAADTTALNVGDGNNGNPAGKVITPTGADANKLATAGDIANAINNSGFNITAGGNTVGNAPVATTAKPGSTLTLKAGDGLTVKQDLDANGNQSYTYALDAQTVVQNAQTPVVYTKADGTKVYKRPDGKFYDAPTGGNEVAAGDVIASMQNAAGNTTDPTTLANVKSNLADTTNAVNNPAGNDRATLAANKGNNAATVNDVLNAGFTVQGNGQNKDFVTHGDTINFANGQGTVANVSTTGGVTTVKFDTPMTYVDNAGNPTSDPSNKVNLVGDAAGGPVTLGNVAPGTLSATSTEAVNGSQLYATNQNVAKGINFGGTTGSNNYQLGDTINVKGDNNITSTTVTGGAQLALNPNLSVTSVTTTDAAGNQTVTNGGGVTITPAGGGNPVSLTTGGLNNGGNKITNVADGTAGTDAVNVGQLNAALGAINSAGNANIAALDAKINDVADTANAGVAQAIATAGLPQAYLPGKNMVAVGGGYYKGETGYAVGFSTISDSGNWIIKATGSGNSRGNFGASIGAGYQW
ncbi:YadA-like family protein [Eikenella corrodens]|uniref:YadA-like family protein n=1 Tax=Eikenella corrodens TaxID=539 RepID=UPI00129B0CE2|nr:YadA-like family protein [Eikenella corrodens]